MPQLTACHWGKSRLRAGLFALAAALVFTAAGLLFAAPASAQFSQPATTPVHDPAALKPPPGARVAIIEFEDMECPDCAATYPVVKAAAEHYHIPWIRHDFPLPFHPWSFQASVYARWFDTKGKNLGNEYRGYIFANQRSIETRGMLTQWTENFARSHGLALPFAVDPQGKLAAEVKADYALGQAIGIQHTPTLWVVTNGANGAAPYTEVVELSRLYQIIDQALRETRK